MSEENNVTPTESPAPAEVTNTDSYMIPKSRFDEVNQAKKDLEARLAQLEQSQAQAKEAELAEQNRWQEIAEQRQRDLEALQNVKTQADMYRQSLQATNEARIEQLPEDTRDIIPVFDDPVKLSAWLDKALPKLQATPKPTAPPLNGGSGNTARNQSGDLSPAVENLAGLARSYGFDINREQLSQRVNSTQKPSKLGD